MFSYLKKVFSNKQLRNRIIFTLFIIVIYEIGKTLPLPLVKGDAVSKLYDQLPVLQVLSTIGGGAFKNFSLFALGVSPYISASMVTQLLQMDIVPALAQWAKEGEIGKRKINMVNRYLAILFAFGQGMAFSFGTQFLGNTKILSDDSIWGHVYISILFSIGTMIVLWLADQISLKGIGNGTSLIISAGIVSGYPSTIFSAVSDILLYQGYEKVKLIILYTIITIVMLMVLIGTVYFYESTRKVPVRYANKQTFSSITTQTHLPLKVNAVGVVPVIFALSILSIPSTVTGFLKGNNVANIIHIITDYSKPIGMLTYSIFIVMFSYFYVMVQMNPEKMAENINKNGGYIPGIRVGEDTENYLKSILLRLTFYGSAFLVVLALLPNIVSIFFDVPNGVTIGGTGLLILIGVAIETYRKIDAQVNTRNYNIFR